MTRGQMLFYAGAVLLAVTVILAIVFAIKKPKYDPGSAAPDAFMPDQVRQSGAYDTPQNLTAIDTDATELLQEGEEGAAELLHEEAEP